MSLRLEAFKVRLDGAWRIWIYWKMSLVIQLDWVDLQRSLPTQTTHWVYEGSVDQATDTGGNWDSKRDHGTKAGRAPTM